MTTLGRLLGVWVGKGMIWVWDEDESVLDLWYSAEERAQSELQSLLYRDSSADLLESINIFKERLPTFAASTPATETRMS